MKVPKKFQTFEEQPLFSEDDVDLGMAPIPTLRFVLDMPPTAHKETKFTKVGHAYSDSGKREYMIAAANALREYEGWFRGCKYLYLTIVFVCERPSKGTPSETNIPGARWREQNLEIMKCSRPDLDNYEKSLQDILSHHIIQRKKRSDKNYIVLVPEIKGAGIVDDDSFFVSKTTHKIYATRANPRPRIEVTIRQRKYIFERKSKKR